jgi:hypothetical protein
VNYFADTAPGIILDRYMGEKKPLHADDSYEHDSDPRIIFTSASADGEFDLTVWIEMGHVDFVSDDEGSNPLGFFGILRIYRAGGQSDLPVHEETVALSEATAHFGGPTAGEINLWDDIMRRHTGSSLAAEGGGE